MKRIFLGDSYDAVKRFWREVLADWAPLYANPQFLPLELRDDYVRLIGIALLTSDHPRDYSILNDPDTGIRLLGETNQSKGRTHISIRSIISQLRDLAPRCTVTFDQSNYRQSGLKLHEQRRAKLESLCDAGVPAFYYVSHAPFLFAFPRNEACQELRGRLIRAGIPACRFQAV